MPSHVRRVLFLILVTLPFLMAPRSAAAEGGISFLGDQPLTIVLPDGQADVRHSVKVMNGGDTSQDIYLDLVGLSDEDGAPVPSGVLPGDLLREENVASGEVRTFELTLTRVDGLSGSYTGQLVAYGDDGTVARLVFTLTVEKPEVGVPKIVPLQPDYLDEVTLPGLKRWPCPLSAFGLDCIKPITAPMGEPASEPQVVGGISGSNGQLGQVVWEGTTLRVEGITRADEYTGKVDLAPDDEEAGEVTLKVQVRDCIIWPVLVLVAGLLISTWLAQQGKVRRPLKRLQIGLAKLKEHAIHLQQEANKALPDNWPATRDVYRVYQMIERTESGLLYTAAKNVEEAFIEAGSDEERKNWGPDGDEFKRVQGYVDALPGLYTLSRAAAGHYRELKLFVSVHDPVLDFDGLEVAKRVRGVLEPTLIDSAPNLEKLQTELKAASIFVSDFRELHKRLVNLKRLAQGTSYESDVDDLYGQLTGARNYPPTSGRGGRYRLVDLGFASAPSCLASVYSTGSSRPAGTVGPAAACGGCVEEDVGRPAEGTAATRPGFQRDLRDHRRLHRALRALPGEGQFRFAG